jgi:hypothetical protein
MEKDGKWWLELGRRENNENLKKKKTTCAFDLSQFSKFGCVTLGHSTTAKTIL